MGTVIKSLFSGTILKDVLNDLLLLDEEAFGRENSWKENNFTIELPGKRELSLVAFSGEQVSGFLIGSIYQSPMGKAAHVNRIVSKNVPDNKGTGSKMIMEFEQEARKAGCLIASLEFSEELKVAGFYQRCGYRAISGETEIIEYLKLKGKENMADEYLSRRRMIYRKELLK